MICRETDISQETIDIFTSKLICIEVSYQKKISFDVQIPIVS